jgi:CBS domain-containing protein
MHVEARMTPEPVVCRPEDSLDTAASRMRDGDCGCLPVVDADGRVVGMVTDRDICMTALTTAATLAEVRVARAMTRHVATTRPLDSLEDAEYTMRQHQVRRLPVVDDRARVIGMLSCHDLLRSVAENGDHGRDGSHTAPHEHAATHLVGTLVAIGRSRLRGAARPAGPGGNEPSSAPRFARVVAEPKRLAPNTVVPAPASDVSPCHAEPPPRP